MPKNNKSRFTINKYSVIAAIAMCVFALCALLCFLPPKVGGADASVENAFSYYSQLNDNAKKFYTAIDAMNKSGALESGNGKYDLIENKVLTEADVKAFQSGASQVLKDFGAGRDAYFLEHPEIFYVDFDALSLSFAVQNGKYTASIDAGRYGSYYINGGFSTATDVASAKTAFNNKVTELKAELDLKVTPKEKVALANTFICSLAIYDFCADDAALASAIRTPYGALVNGKAVCEGYSRAFKVLMDTQDIPCIEVVGYVYDENNNLEPHAWNYVSLDGKWYIVDCTYNDAASYKEDYLLLGAEYASAYVENGVISQSGFEFKYPTLATYNYGCEELSTVIEYDYDDYDNSFVTVKYEGKNADQLKDEDKYIVCANETDEGWQPYFALALADAPEKMPVNTYVKSMKFVATTQAPDYFVFKYTSLDESLIFAKSDVIYNEQYNTIPKSPNPRNMTPSNSALLDAGDTYDISIEYDAELKKVDGSKDVGISIKDSDLQTFVKIENVVFDGNRTISFTLTPSKMYKHDLLTYYITPTNIVGKTSNAAPRAASFTFSKPWSVCSKVYNDGRLYMNIYGEPTLIDNQDLSMTGFVDEYGNQVAENQRSQLVLVATKPDSKTASDMMDSSIELAGIDAKDVKASATFELDLHICGVLQEIPAGSYMKLAFGFPEGFGPENKGTTFKVYHFKKGADGKIDPTQTEEIPCVVTEYGLVVVVNSFSPFMVMAVDSSKVTSETKNVYAYQTTVGGKVSAKVGTTDVNGVAMLNSGETIEYTLTPNDGMQVDYVLLNQKKIDVVDNKFSLSYDSLKSENEIKIAFVATSVANYESANKIENLNKQFAQNETVATVADKDKKSSTLEIVLAIIIILAVVGICVAIVLITRKSLTGKSKK